MVHSCACKRVCYKSKVAPICLAFLPSAMDPQVQATHPGYLAVIRHHPHLTVHPVCTRQRTKLGGPAWHHHALAGFTKLVTQHNRALPLTCLQDFCLGVPTQAEAQAQPCQAMPSSKLAKNADSPSPRSAPPEGGSRWAGPQQGAVPRPRAVAAGVQAHLTCPVPVALEG